METMSYVMMPGLFLQEEMVPRRGLEPPRAKAH